MPLDTLKKLFNKSKEPDAKEPTRANDKPIYHFVKSGGEFVETKK